MKNRLNLWLVGLVFTLLMVVLPSCQDESTEIDQLSSIIDEQSEVNRVESHEWFDKDFIQINTLAAANITGQLQAYDIGAGTSWYIESTHTWLSASPDNGSGGYPNNPITVSVTASTSKHNRLGYLYIVDVDGTKRDTCAVRQMAPLYSVRSGTTLNNELIGSAPNNIPFTFTAYNLQPFYIYWDPSRITLRNNGKLKISIRKNGSQKQEWTNVTNNGVLYGTLDLSGSWNSTDEYYIALVDVKSGSSNIVLWEGPEFLIGN